MWCRRQRQSAEDGHNKFTNVTENSYYGRFSVQKEQTKSFVIFTAQNSTRVPGLSVGSALHMHCTMYVLVNFKSGFEVNSIFVMDSTTNVFFKYQKFFMMKTS